MPKNNYNSRSKQRRRNYSANVSEKSNSLKVSGSFSGKSFGSQSCSKIVAKEIVKHMNGVKGRNIEENICKTLENEYNWKPSKFERHFFYRKFIIDKDYDILTANKEIEIPVNNKLFYIKVNEDLTCEVRKKKNGNGLLIENNGKDYKVNNLILIQKSDEIEFDGLYKLKNAKFPNFNNNEICLLYNFLDYKNNNDNEDIRIHTIDDGSYNYSNKIDENDSNNKGARNIRKYNDNNNASKTKKK